jgi:hypothetical protein
MNVTLASLLLLAQSLKVKIADLFKGLRGLTTSPGSVPSCVFTD